MGVGGGLCTWLFSPHSNTVGASGGCYALLGMHVADLLLNWRLQAFPRARIIFFLCFLTADLTNYSLAKNSTISHTTHVGGFITGLVFYLILGRNFTPTPRDKYKRGWAIFAIFVMFLGIVVWYVTFPFPGVRSFGDLFRDLFRDVIPGASTDFHPVWCWVGQACVFPEYAKAGTCHKGLWQCVGCHTRECVEGWYDFVANNTSPPIYVVQTTWATCRDMPKLLEGPVTN